MAVQLSNAIVVGASSGIGAALARSLAASGAQVAVVARRAAPLAELAAQFPGQVRYYVHDVRDAGSVPELLARIVSDLGGLDAFLYSAGVMPRIDEGEYNVEKDREMIEVNLLGAMAWINPVAARFEAARTGTILAISSIAGERGRRGNPGYCTSKAALSTYLESMRNRCSRYGVNVVTIKPGFVETDMTRGLPGLFWTISADEAARQTLALARRGTSASGFVPARWGWVARAVRWIPSFLFRKLNF